MFQLNQETKEEEQEPATVLTSSGLLVLLCFERNRRFVQLHSYPISFI